MDFGALPPEINSARMYSGAGSAPMLTAALAWDELAAELHEAVDSYRAVLSGLTGAAWSGPASLSMLAAAAPYTAWLGATAAQAEQAAANVRLALGAYQSAFAVTVPPPVIAANRSMLAALVASNILGQHSPAIAATETAYAEMWAQDASAMYGYADGSAAAWRLTPFDQPSAAASGHDAAAARLATAAQQALQHLQSEVTPAWVKKIVKALATSEQVVQRYTSTPANLLGILQKLNPTAAVSSAPSPAGAPPTAAVAAARSGGPVSASTARAGTLGRLSVPPSWVSAPAAAAPDAASLRVGAAGGGADSPSAMLCGMPMSGSGRRADPLANRQYGFRKSVIPRPTVAG